MIDNITETVLLGTLCGIALALAIFVLSCAPQKLPRYVSLGEPCPDTCKCEVYPR